MLFLLKGDFKMKDPSKERKIYVVKNMANNSLSKQLERTTNTLKDTTNYLFSRDIKAFNAGEIYNCFLNNHNELVKVIVIKSSSVYEPNVLVCPLKSKYECYLNDEEGINLGKIHSLDLNTEFIAQIQKIRLINKDDFKINNIKIKDIKSCGMVNKLVILKILMCYREFISSIINMNIKFEINNTNYLKECTC